MIYRIFLLLPLCIMLCSCSRSYSDEVSLDELTDVSLLSEDGSVSDEDNGSQDASVNEAGSGDDHDTVDDGKIYVYACGEVVSPGVYEIDADSRVFEVLSLAGGMTEDADISFINQAEAVYDGERIYVPAVGEYDITYGVSASQDTGDNRININTADSAGLQQIKGIGESRAGDIISYRESNGRFSCIEDIMNVPGIKQGTFDKIKDQIKV